MKKWIVLILGSLVFQASYAADGLANLRINISSSSQGNTYFLCLSGAGCFNINSHQKAFPIDATQVDELFMANVANLRMYPQALPNSCQVAVNQNQTLTVAGHLIVKNNNAYINQLHCVVT